MESRQNVERRCDAVPARSDVPCDGQPVAASVIIPLFNKVEYTVACLRRLVAVTTPGTYELVMVDNGSTDGTGAVLDSLGPEIRTVRNPTNLGFAKACNQGAEAATGRHLVFLNNDTEPHPGWLEPLLDILDTEPDVGIVGSKLLFPDGLVQHAGVWMVTNERGDSLDGYHRLYRTAPDDPLVDRRVELPAVTGACMAVRREAFAAAGGFDEIYWNGNEDVEICLRARAAGYRVVYDPRSTLTHHESVSGPERFSRVEQNRQTLAERWLSRIVPDARWHYGSLRAVTSELAGGSPCTVKESPASPSSSARPRSKPAQPAVDVVGYLGRRGRPDSHTADVLAMLSAAGVPHNVTLYHRSFIGDAEPAFRGGEGGDPGRVLIVCVEPDAIGHFATERGGDLFRGRYVIASWSWPHPEVPPEYGDALRLAHEFWVSSPALRAWLEPRVPGDAVLVRRPVSGNQRRSPRARNLFTELGLDDRFTFTAVAELIAADRADAAHTSIDAFTRTFDAPGTGTSVESPALLVGVSGGTHLPWAAHALVEAAGGRPDVFFVDLDAVGLEARDIATTGDCHLEMRGMRGRTTPALHALGTGVPVVTVSHAANSEIVSTNTCYVIPESADAVETLRRVASNPQEATKRGRRAARDVTDRHAPERVARLVRERLRRAGSVIAILDGQAS